MTNAFPADVSVFRVCRCCRKIFAEPSGSPFCDGQCATDWGRMVLQAFPSMRTRFLCGEPPWGPEGWRAKESVALKEERIG